MKSFKDIFSEVAQPNNPEEQKFKDQHAIQVFDHPVAEPSQFTGEIQGKGRALKRLSDYVSPEDENAYDQAYKEAVEEIAADEDVSIDQEDDISESNFDVAVNALLENPQEEIPMMRQQLAFITYAAREIDDYLQMGVDPEEWYQNKLAYAFAQMKSLHAYAEGDRAMMDRPSDYDDYYYDSFTRRIAKYESIEESFKQGKLKLQDGSSVTLKKDDAVALEKMMKSVGSKNRKQMELDLMKDKKSFMDMLKFAKEAG